MNESCRVVAIGQPPALRHSPYHIFKDIRTHSSPCATTPTRDVKTLNLLHHLIRAESVESQMAILNRLAGQDTNPYSAILLHCAARSIVFGQEYSLLQHYAKVIVPNDDNAEARRTMACTLLGDTQFMDVDGSFDFLNALGPFEASSSLYSTLYIALRTHTHIAVQLWDKSISLPDSPVSFPPGMLLDFARIANDQTEYIVLVEIARIFSRLLKRPYHKKEIMDISSFPLTMVRWLSRPTQDNNTNELIDMVADIMSDTSNVYEWSQHRAVHKRLWEMAEHGRGLTAVVKIAAPHNTKLSLVHSMAKHINVDDVDVDESSILAAQAIKRMVQSLSVRVKAYPETLDLLASLSYAKNRHVRFWAVQGLSEQSQHARFYLARSNLCLRALLLTMKKDFCLRVRAASSIAVCNICKDPANAIALVRRSDVLPSLVSCLWRALEGNCNQQQHHGDDTCCELYVEAILALVSHKAVDPDRLANTFRLVDALMKYGNHNTDIHSEFDETLQRAALRSVSLLEPFRQTRRWSL